MDILLDFVHIAAFWLSSAVKSTENLPDVHILWEDIECSNGNVPMTTFEHTYYIYVINNSITTSN